MTVDIEVNIWLASKTRWAHLVKVIQLPSVPRVGEYLKFRNAVVGDYFPWRVSEVTYREAAEVAVSTELLENIDDRGYSFEDETEFDEYYSSYLAEGWRCERGIGPNKRYQGAAGARQRRLEA